METTWVSPRIRWAMTAPETEAMTTMPIVSAVKETRISSRVKTAPASGVLKVAAMPPAAPAPHSSVSWRVESLSFWPKNDPIAAPTWTMGPSLPTGPPPPIVSAVAMILTIATRPGMTPPLRRTASMTSGTPWPRANGEYRLTATPQMRPAIAGTAMTKAGCQPVVP